MEHLKIKDKGLVLEGGGMRGVFTCGVLDCLIDNKIEFPYIVGVSAGACNGLSYISKQRGRAKFSNIDLLEKYNYIGLKHFIRKRNIMDFDILFHDLPEKIYPYDYDSYFSSNVEFEIVTTNCLTGKSEYLKEKRDKGRLLDIARASSSLPVMCPVTHVDSIPMLDGGISDSIPIQRAIDKGFEKNIVILTQNKGYRKKAKGIKLPPLMYRKYPTIRKALFERNSIYNKQLELIDDLEDKGEILVIRPINPIKVGRIEKDTTKLTELYEEGYNCTSSLISQIIGL